MALTCRKHYVNSNSNRNHHNDGEQKWSQWQQIPCCECKRERIQVFCKELYNFLQYQQKHSKTLLKGYFFIRKYFLVAVSTSYWHLANTRYILKVNLK